MASNLRSQHVGNQRFALYAMRLPSILATNAAWDPRLFRRSCSVINGRHSRASGSVCMRDQGCLLFVPVQIRLDLAQGLGNREVVLYLVTEIVEFESTEN